jgi:ABC-type transport system involved in Fe-S cluster assembly fused permease/ATPase subunit
VRQARISYGPASHTISGSGKSTLAMSILRFVDPASGRILIDGIDISTIGLHDLRSRIVRRLLLLLSDHNLFKYIDIYSTGKHVALLFCSLLTDFRMLLYFRERSEII